MPYHGDCESIVKPNPEMSWYPLDCPELPRVSFETSLELPASLEPRNLDSLRLNSPELYPDPDPGPFYSSIFPICINSLLFMLN